MSVLTKPELLSKMKEVLGERTDDAALGILEDIEDSMQDGGEELSKLKKELETVKTEKEELDKVWRERYRDRFLNGVQEKEKSAPESNPEPGTPDKPGEDIEIDDLFTEKGE